MVSYSRIVRKIRTKNHYYKAFEIFYSFQGPQGLFQKPSKQQLESDFGEPEDEYHFYKKILERGHLNEQSVEYKKGATKNVARSNNVLDTRGMRNTSGI
jgi:hypothetical protein